MNEFEAHQLAVRTGGAPFTIDVYCDNSHPERDVASCVIDPSHEPPTWNIYGESTKWRFGHGQQPTKAHADARVVLRGDRRLTDDEITADIFADPDVRVRYQFRCHLCGRSEEFRGEKLHSRLDRIALGGLQRIRLVQLAAIVFN